MDALHSGLVRALSAALICGAAGFGPSEAAAQERAGRGRNSSRHVVAELQERLDAGEAKLERGEQGYLRSLLRELGVPESSQMLVYSKTSLQRDHITPQTPRAIYFGDDVMIGYIPDAPMIEIAAAEGSGTAFFTIDQAGAGDRPTLERQGLTCVGCHSTSATRGVTGLLVRSLSVDGGGRLLLDQPTYRTEHSSPLAERWGGWYVTGASGRQEHLGNRIGPPPGAAAAAVDESDEETVEPAALVLNEHVAADRYPHVHSDIVALMVFEHQVGMFNRLARAGTGGRRGQRDQADSARKRFEAAGDEVVKHLLFTDEVPLADRVAGSSTFAQDFAARGPRDSQGRSLRDFDLTTRMFRYPCSYLIYSRTFDALPGDMKEYIYQRLWDSLAGPQADQLTPHLSAEDRQAIVEILRETKERLPEYWKSAASG
jgi:hypothetical protein